ncbi:MAG TPA: 5-amino-6-(D-ribitylamino)uracil--L-tyrosine 4-hydroxyphenyl transferase CofH [Acidimicrobiia bacterium]|nr:5-amino-6-(D-ribitylamino)uracil--L-tyrosine 4-hydroxyphenyl transferase CofH [Acidimicrobiia bacterium]
MSRRVTFVRSRPAEAVNQIAATTRRREGTTVLEMAAPSGEAVVTAAREGVLVASSSPEHPAPAFVVGPDRAAPLERLGVAGWRITVAASASWESTLDALARLRAPYLRVGRSSVTDWVHRTSLPGLDVTVSVFVDDVDQAVAAVESGAGDLVLRDWSGERIGELRDALGAVALIERSAFPLGVEIDEVRQDLDPTSFTAWLGQVDGSGAARPRWTWAPGKDERPPVPDHRFSAEWSDAVWVTGRAPEQLDGAGRMRPMLERSLAGSPPSLDELELLFTARGDEVDAVAWAADALRQRTSGDEVSYVVNRNINYTNMCYFRCGFCAFSKGPRSLNLRGDPYLMGVPEIVERAREAWARGATEVTLQGGIHPEFTGEFYVGVVEAIKAELPEMHIHGFTPLEVWQGAETLDVTVRDFLARLADAGLGSLPGTAAEILDDDVRLHLCPDKIRTAQWAEVMLTAHDLGLRATATIMFGHIDHPRSWARHYEVIREIQRRTGGFTEFVPLPFVHMGSPIFLRGSSRPGPTWDETVLVHAIARLAFDGLIDNIQASWVKLGLDGGSRLLDAGCNDLGGTLMGEIITRAAGAAHGQEMTPGEFEDAIRAAGRRPVRRNTVYARIG